MSQFSTLSETITQTAPDRTNQDVCKTSRTAPVSAGGGGITGVYCSLTFNHNNKLVTRSQELRKAFVDTNCTLIVNGTICSATERRLSCRDARYETCQSVIDARSPAVAQKLRHAQSRHQLSENLAYNFVAQFNTSIEH